MSITGKYLEAALLDQNVAGTFFGKKYAYVSVFGEDGWKLGVAVANEGGYNPIALNFASKAECDEWADGLNEHIGLSKDEAAMIICSTMGGRQVLQ